MKISDTAIRYIVCAIVAVLLIGLGYASFASKKQDEQFLADQATYNQSLQYLQEEDFGQAILLLQQVEINNSNNAIVKYYLGLAHANTGEWSKATMEFQTVLDLNPYKVKDGVFMIQFANILVDAKKLDQAKVVLEHCQTLPNPGQMPDYQEQINALLKRISVGS
ncbi:hypothetical protein PB01_03635 [Psychrobacillus glaciei]|uniref:Ancillary SecYEG translocon subunit/Cell division coordinator CpoB TPR domain-containing protein n=1 Tax=Psychrobacillus glaciei TaxID=2283160 RepID=A0A5J6SJ86_9BACI|nr:tetratricopeptide repeat protein [Psychrobacillus glaciei]QFF97980.1 hypothetical protein PB01_03635 [Psychrobacillus glaciei]